MLKQISHSNEDPIVFEACFVGFSRTCINDIRERNLSSSFQRDLNLNAVLLKPSPKEDVSCVIFKFLHVMQRLCLCQYFLGVSTFFMKGVVQKKAQEI
jgi:hypothetical protein